MLVFGHGGSEPDNLINSAAAFERVVACGADGVELDVRLAADGALPVIHDPTYADGRSVAKVNGDQRPPDVIDLATALDICAGLIVNIELKNYPKDAAFDPSQAIVDRVIALLGARGDKDRVLLSCFGIEAIDRVRELRPELETAHLVLSRKPPAEVVAACVDHGHTVINPYLAMVDDRFMETARAHDLTVNVWTGTDESDSDVVEMLRLDVDGLITARPRRALRVRDQ